MTKKLSQSALRPIKNSITHIIENIIERQLIAQQLKIQAAL